MADAAAVDASRETSIVGDSTHDPASVNGDNNKNNGDNNDENSCVGELSVVSPLRVEEGDPLEPLPEEIKGRPRTVSQEQASLLSSLAGHGVNWHSIRPSEPCLVFPVVSIRGSGVFQANEKMKGQRVTAVAFRSGAKFQRSNTVRKSIERTMNIEEPQIELLSKDKIQQVVRLSTVLDVKRERGKPWVIRMDYNGMRPTSSGPGSPIRMNFAIEFVSVLDADDVVLFITHYIHHQSPPHFRFGQICLHKGPVEKQKQKTWLRSKRYIMLINHKLLVYRKAESEYPTKIITLARELAVGLLDKNYVASVSCPTQNGVVVDIKAASELHTDRLSFRVKNTRERDQWVEAIRLDSEGHYYTTLTYLTGTSRSAASVTHTGQLRAAEDNNFLTKATNFIADEVFRGRSRTRAPTKLVEEEAPPTVASVPMPGLEGSEDEINRVLTKFLEDQVFFFKFIKTNVSGGPVLLRSLIMNANEWKTRSAVKRWRGKTITLIDEAVTQCEAAATATSRLLKAAKIVCSDAVEMSGTSQLGFSMGDASAVFFVGRTAVVSAVQCFEKASPLSFEEEDWRGAWGNVCVGKELMQCSPNLNAMYEQGEIEKAKQINRHSQLASLHNICLASFVRSRSLHANDSSYGRGDVFSWVNVLTHLKTCNLPTEFSAIVESWKNVAYIINPNHERMLDMAEKEMQKVQEAVADAAARGSVEETIKEKEEKEDVEGEEDGQVAMRVLVSPAHFVLMLSTLLDFRKRRVEELGGLIAVWIGKHQADLDSEDRGVQSRFETTAILKKQVDDEARALHELANVLPNTAQISKFIEASATGGEDGAEIKAPSRFPRRNTLGVPGSLTGLMALTAATQQQQQQQQASPFSPVAPKKGIMLSRFASPTRYGNGSPPGGAGAGGASSGNGLTSDGGPFGVMSLPSSPENRTRSSTGNINILKR